MASETSKNTTKIKNQKPKTTTKTITNKQKNKQSQKQKTTNKQKPTKIVAMVFPSHELAPTEEGKKEMFYLTTNSTHFIYGYMASDIW